MKTPTTECARGLLAATQPVQPKLLRLFLWAVLPIAIGYVLFMTVLALNERQILGREISLEQQSRVEVQSDLIEAQLRLAVSDARFLADLAALEIDANELRPAKANLQRIFTDFIKDRLSYSQILLLGADGEELARVERTGDGLKVADDGELIDRKDRDYFQGGLHTGFGVYVSGFEDSPEDGGEEASPQSLLHIAGAVEAGGGAHRLGGSHLSGEPAAEEPEEFLLHVVGEPTRPAAGQAFPRAGRGG